LIANLPLVIPERLDEVRNRRLPKATQSFNGLLLGAFFLAPQQL
jgi:hypothetical protein